MRQRGSWKSPIGVIEIEHQDLVIGSLRFGTEISEDLPRDISQYLERYFDGELTALDALRIAPSGTAFQHEVWTSLRALPVGETTSYLALAQQLGRPRAVRAVARANALNPIALIVPCHRVIGSDGALRGYAYGLERKRWLIDHELRSVRAGRAPRGSAETAPAPSPAPA